MTQNEPRRPNTGGGVDATEVLLPGPVAPEGLVVRHRRLDPPGPGRVTLRMEATGVSFAEQQMRRGKYFDQPPFPFVPGYDLVGSVTEVGPGADPTMKGRRYAALTKVGAWASHVVLPATDLVPVPEGTDPGTAEALVVNGVTAYRMLHQLAHVRSGDTVLVHGANGGVGSLLVQLARHAGATVIGTASARNAEAVRSLGATPLDYREPDLPGRVRALAPDGVNAVFDHVGGPGLVDSFGLLARGGTLVSYGTAATRDVDGNAMLPVLLLFARLLRWNTLPNGRGAHFFNLWSGHRRRVDFQRRLARDLGAVLDLHTEGVLDPPVAARVPLSEVASAMTLAESGTVVGKVLLVPDQP
ncbi:medium chain dehydrogenase/reductase family protein [Nocardiopsis sp. B62]|uniref:medium chain dehydrogenase/reductase family protein n=1 Tax=Nocardiopsis sp. B62 TaxID=2824874 RepID=UPI001B387130|nr:medium chain dehydrogenase/reductase family protein [Nocardiopsis sp. B62]MBQ1082098.1 zinc-binding dehydrogenase [Nocardiopsis sp. B62]